MIHVEAPNQTPGKRPDIKLGFQLIGAAILEHPEDVYSLVGEHDPDMPPLSFQPKDISVSVSRLLFTNKDFTADLFDLIKARYEKVRWARYNGNQNEYSNWAWLTSVFGLIGDNKDANTAQLGLEAAEAELNAGIMAGIFQMRSAKQKAEKFGILIGLVILTGLGFLAFQLLKPKTKK